MPDFTLHPQLAADTLLVGDLPLCRVLLMNDVQFPWCILVPRVGGITEIIDLSEQQQHQLWQESAQLSLQLQSLCQPDKLNVAALGNMVPQLHIHHIARFRDDPVWPKPVWGNISAKPYGPGEAEQLINRLREGLGLAAC
ncbi:HIT domain-containing protein [Aestuariibacter halophilus]|uniref:HIT domain-containing protein n=1 Tax=Fluctibacter halophilus TaxID=226011 RepID=A0ABS8G650_9ALTE|nr:HIT domain-containing protein [Aestuariibacter halophilus]MCC2616000.1 HIT domain-containing protein [Aestuariibacter halophilus]